MPLCSSTRFTLFCPIGSVSSMPMRFGAGLSCAPSGADASASAPAMNFRREVMAGAILRPPPFRYKRRFSGWRSCGKTRKMPLFQPLPMPKAFPKSIDETQALLASGEYVADRSLATSLFLSLAMRRPLFLEGEAGVGKTEIGKVVATALGRELIRLQCYEGLDIAQAAYEWNYSRQMIEIRLAEAAGEKDKKKLGSQIYSDEFLVKRPLARALEGDSPVLLIDELDRTDEPFEAYLLEVLSDWQITIPEIGTLKAKTPPIVIITSNRTREIDDAVKRRCFYHWVDYPDAKRELEILHRKAPKAASVLSKEDVAFVQGLRKTELVKLPGVAETIDWANCLVALDRVALDPETVNNTLGVLLKYRDDLERVAGEEAERLVGEAKAAAAA